MKKTIKALWHGIKAVFTAIVDWVAKLFGMSPEPIPENLSEEETKKLKAKAKYMRSLRTVVGSCLAFFMAFGAMMLIVNIVDNVCWRIDKAIETDKEMFRHSYFEDAISDNISYYERSDCYFGFIADSNDNILLKRIAWIALPLEGDSLVCYSDGNYRGYFHMNDGRVVVEPTYGHAWIFSEGLAAVESKGKIKFINAKGDVVIDCGFAFDDDNNGYVFHQGHCAVNDSTGKHMGLIDRNGRWVLEPRYESIYADDTFWVVSNGKEMSIFTFGMDTVMPPTCGSLYIIDTVIFATFPDHTQSQYNLQGKLITANQIRDVDQLMYETTEVVYPTGYSGHDDDSDLSEYYGSEPYTRQAVATCLRYEAECGWYGLMSTDGRILTPPSYVNIKAIGKDCYLCETDYGRGIILNSQGRRVE